MKAKSRAAPLSPEERRAAILDAVIRLLIDKGAAVTTAEMAAAAGIAEGTIFRVFPDKAALLHEAIRTALDPTPLEVALENIDRAAAVEVQMAAASDLLVARFEKVTALLGMLRSIPHDVEPHADVHRVAADSMAAVVGALTTFMEKHHASLRIEPERAAVILRGMAFANAHPVLFASEKLTGKQLADVLLRGIAREMG